MISLESARKLKEAGLAWQPLQGDQFAIPDRGMDTQRFVINDMATIMETLQGTPAITFHGTPEWALDYIHIGETIWLPSEEQLRTELERVLAQAGITVYDLLYLGGTYTCRFELRGEALAFPAPSAAEAYASAVLSILGSEQGKG